VHSKCADDIKAQHTPPSPVGDGALLANGPAIESVAKLVPSRDHSNTNLALIVLAVIAVVAALYFARAFFVPLLIGILASYTLRPVVDGLQALRIPRAVAAAIVLVVPVSGVSSTAYSLRGEAAVLIEKLPDAARKLRQNLSSTPNTVTTALQNVQEAANELQRVAADASQSRAWSSKPC
jgi:predicted PurR-regulated permease PerM